MYERTNILFCVQVSKVDRFEKKIKEEFDKLEKDYDGLQLVLDSMKDSYVCDCGKGFPWNFGKVCKYPEKYRDGGCK